MPNLNGHEEESGEEKIELKTIDDLATYVVQTLELTNELMLGSLQSHLAIQKALEELVEQVRRFADIQINEGDSHAE